MDNSDSLLHTLYQTTRIISRGVNRVLEPWGLYSSEWSIIRALKLNGPQTQRALAASLHIEPPAITKSLAVLQQKGYIERSEGTDRRTKQVTLSDQALQLYPLWVERIREHRSALLVGLSPEDQDALRHLLATMRENARTFMQGAEGEQERP